MILLIDGNNMAYRALYKFNLSNNGKDVSVTFGVFRMIISIIKRHHPQSVVVAWDGGVPAYRRALLPQYKAHRKKDDRDWEDVYRQMNELCDYALPMCGIMTLRQAHTEADDLLAVASRMASDRPYIVSMDDDLLQCVDKRTSVIKPLKGIVVTSHNFKKEIGVLPEDYLLYKTLVGDGSDNIPGVKSIGPKTAAKLVAVWDNYPDLFNPKALSSRPNALNMRQYGSLKAVGADAFWTMYDVMDLSYDRVGAHKVIYDSVYHHFDAKRLKRYFMRNAFVSLVGGDVMRVFDSLRAPEFRECRHPVVPVVRRSA